MRDTIEQLINRMDEFTAKEAVLYALIGRCEQCVAAGTCDYENAGNCHYIYLAEWLKTREKVHHD